MPDATTVDAVKYRDTVLPGVIRAENEYLLQQGKKRCDWCGQIKSRDDFYTRKTGSWDGKMNHCSQCSKNNLYRWIETNPDKWARNQKVQSRRTVVRDPLFRRIHDGRARARKAGRQYDIFNSKQLFAHWESVGIDPWTCYYCGCQIANAKRLHLDHLIPFTRGGDHTVNNLVPACMIDNLTKHNRTPEEYTDFLTTHVRKSTKELLRNRLQGGAARATKKGLPSHDITVLAMTNHWIVCGIDPDSCYWCKDGDAEHLDHLYALSRPDSPGHVLENLVPSCAGCNHQKGSFTPDEYARFLAEVQHAVDPCPKRQLEDRLTRAKACILRHLGDRPNGDTRSHCANAASSGHGRTTREEAQQAIDQLLHERKITQITAPATQRSKTGIQGITLCRGKYRVRVGNKYVGIFVTLDAAKQAQEQAIEQFGPVTQRTFLVITPQISADVAGPGDSVPNNSAEAA